MVAQGAVAFSVHSYPHPLEKVVRPKRIWGDLHLFFKCPHEGWPDTIQPYIELAPDHLPPMVREVLDYYHVPLRTVQAYFHIDGIELIISEATFRGDIGSPGRLDFDHKIQELIEASPLQSTQINQTPVFWSEATPKLSSTQVQHGIPLSPLASEYFMAHEDALSRKDYLKPNPAYIHGCKVFEALLSKQSVTEEHLAMVCRLIGANIPFFLELIEMHGGGHLLRGLNRQRFKTSMQEFSKSVSCDEAATFIAGYESNNTCLKGCGVTSPLALQYLPSSPTQTQIPYKSHNGIQLNPTGLYMTETDGQQTRLMNPIWVEELMSFDQEEMGCRRLICFDDAGFRKELVVSEKDTSSTQLFALLHSYRVYTPNNTQDKGLIRDYLVSQFPRKSPSKPSLRVSKYGGWQKDNSFIFPDSEISSALSYTLQSHEIPVGVDNKKLLPPASIHTRTSDPHALLATLASLSAPFLQHRNLSGVCIHFHGGTANIRAAVIHAASSVWRLLPYSFADAQKHIVALKRQYKDAALCILEVPPSDKKSMRSLIRRCFIGRKGADKKISGIIISCGEKPIGQTENHEKGLNVFTHHNNVMAIDVSLDNANTASFRFDHNATRSLVYDFIARKEDCLNVIRLQEKQFKKELTWANRPRLNKQIADYLRYFMAMGTPAQSADPGWWRGGALVPIFDQLMAGIDHRDAIFFELLRLMKLSMPLPDTLKQLGAPGSASIIEINKNRVLVPSATMARITKDRPTLLRFISWLEARKVLIPKRPGILCGEYYSPRHHKTLRGYMISTRHFAKLAS